MRIRIDCWLVGGSPLQESVELAGNGALAAAAELALALALGEAAAGVGPGRPVMDLAQHHDRVQGPMQQPVPATIQPMELGLGGQHDAIDVGCPTTPRTALGRKDRLGVRL
jgi:hypothetical protein